MNIDVRKAILNLIIPHWRQNRLVAWMYALGAPIRALYADLCRFRDEIEYKVMYNGQVCHLTKVLNDRWDPEQHRIRVLNSGTVEAVWICPKSANEPVYTDFYVTDRAYYVGSVGYDFIVVIDFDLVSSQEYNELVALINYYKLSGKTPCIIYT